MELSQSSKSSLAESLWWLALLRLGLGAVMLGALGELTDNSLSSLVLIVMFGIIVVLTFVSVPLLMKRERLGWLLFFLTMPVQAVGVAVSLIWSSNLILVGAIVGAVVAGYLLWLIRNDL